MKLILTLITLLSMSQSGLAADCSELWANGFPDVRPMRTPVACDEYHPHSVPTTITQRFYTVTSLTVNEAVKLQMEFIAEAVSYSVSKFEVFGRVPSITIVRQDIPHPNSGGTAAMAFAYVEFFDLHTESCPIFVYPISEVLNKEHLQQMIAHEVFHCVQKMNFKDQVLNASTSSDQAWWFEGLAQLFSNFVYPANDFEYTARFPAPNQQVAFFDQDVPYSSESFWQSYSNTTSEHQVWSIMNQMPTSAGEMPMVTANNLPRISEAVHNYAKQISLKKVRDSAGPMSPYDMPFEPHVLADTAHQEIFLNYVDFAPGAFQVKLPKAGKWRLRFEVPEETKVSLKKAEEEEYHPVSEERTITSECERERDVQIVITRVSDQYQTNRAKLIVEKEPNPECDCSISPDNPPQEDRCLLGTWDLDHSSVQQFWDRINRNPRVRFAGSSGGFSVSFLPGFIGLWTANSWVLSAIAEMDHGMTMHYTRTTIGISGFTISANGNIACTRQTSSGMTARQRISINGRTTSDSSVLPFDPSAGTFTYTCNESTFIFRVYSIGDSRQDIEYVFHRR